MSNSDTSAQRMSHDSDDFYDTANDASPLVDLLQRQELFNVPAGVIGSLSGVDGAASEAESVDGEGDDGDVLFVAEDYNPISGSDEAIPGSSSNLHLHLDNNPNTGPNRNSSGDLESQGRAGRRLSARERIVNVVNRLFPVRQTYDRINNGLLTGRMQANVPGNFVGQGTDGVFRNLAAKPDTESQRIDLERNPPSYDEAAADATPEYWESTVIYPMYEDEVFVEGLPVGNVANFVWNALVSVAFQFVGFVLCYLLHTSHASKQGSRAGLGITFIVYGYTMIPNNFGHADSVPTRLQPSNPNDYNVNANTIPLVKNSSVDKYKSNLLQQHLEELSELFETNTPYLAYGVIAFGLFLILKAVIDYGRIKQIERTILAPQASANAAAPESSAEQNVSASGETSEAEES